MIHQLKTEKKEFEDILEGKMTFGIRFNDRMFEVGDFLAFNEIEAIEKKNRAMEDGVTYTGRCCLVKVMHILNNEDYIRSGYVALGFHPCEIRNNMADFRMSYDGKSLYAVKAY